MVRKTCPRKAGQLANLPMLLSWMVYECSYILAGTIKWKPRALLIASYILHDIATEWSKCVILQVKEWSRETVAMTEISNSIIIVTVGVLCAPL